MDNEIHLIFLRGYMLRYKNREGKRPRIIDDKQIYEYGHRYSTMKLLSQMKTMAIVNDTGDDDYSIKGITYNMGNMNKLLKFSKKLKGKLPANRVFDNQNINALEPIPIEDLNYTIQLVNLSNISKPDRTPFDVFLKKVSSKLEYKDIMFCGEIKLKDFYKSNNPWNKKKGEESYFKISQVIYFSDEIDEERSHIFDIEDYITTEILNSSKKKELDILAGFRPSENIFNEYKRDFIKILDKYNSEDLEKRWSNDSIIIAQFKSITDVGLLDNILKEESSNNFNIFLKDMFTLVFEEFYGFIFDPYDSYEISEDNCKIKETGGLYGVKKYSIVETMHIAFPRGGTGINPKGVQTLIDDFGYKKISSKNKNTSVNNEEGQQDVQGTGQVNVQGTRVTNETTTNHRSLRAEGNLDFTVGSVSDERSFWWPSDMSLMTFYTDKKYFTYIPTKMPTNQPPSEPPSEPRPELPPGPQPGPQPKLQPEQPTGNSPAMKAFKEKIHKAGAMIQDLKESIPKQLERVNNINKVKYGGGQEKQITFADVKHGIELESLENLLEIYREDLLTVKEENIRKLDIGLTDLIENEIPKQEKKLRQYGSKINQVIWDLFEDKKDPREDGDNFSELNVVNKYMQKLEYEYIEITGDTIVIQKKPYEWDHTLYETANDRLRINPNNKKIVGDITYTISERTLSDINPKFKLLRKCFKPIQGSPIWNQGIEAKNLKDKELCYDSSSKKTDYNFHRFRTNSKMKIIVDNDLLFTESESSSTAKCKSNEIVGIFPFDYSQTHDENTASDNMSEYLQQELTIDQFGENYTIDGYYMHTDLFLKTIGVIYHKNQKKETETELKDLRQEILNRFEKYGWKYVAPDALRIESSSLYEDQDDDEGANEVWEHYGKSDIFFY